jgi:hypothetical protein
MTADAVVVHLVWGPLGLEPVDRFVAAYRAYDAGAPHRLLVVLNGFGAGDDASAVRERFAALDVHELRLESPCIDLAAYRRAIDEVDAAWLLFLNSYSEPLDDGWLAKPLEHLSRPGVGLVGATASYEGTPAGITERLLRRRAICRFPNPHIRTNAFMLAGPLARELDWGDVRSKRRAWALENGPRSLTSQVRARGLDAVVVGRDGKAYPRDQWRAAAVFRAGGQENLLVSDNRTREYAEATPARRRELERLAWG